MTEQRVGVLGASSLVGERLLRLLAKDGSAVIAFSRSAADRECRGVSWRETTTQSAAYAASNHIENWLCVAPIWVLPEHFLLLESYAARRVVVLSSTSRFTKKDSSDAAENTIALRLIDGEARVREWAESKGIEWVILRPTLIYGHGKDKNIAEIAHFIRRFGFFPLLGVAMGLRQPVHADDVATACIAALKLPMATNLTYNLSGAETLPYREMVGRVFAALKRRPILVTIPLSIFRIAVCCFRLLPRYRHWSAAMAERMNHDLVFDHSDATRDLDFSPRPFRLTPEDLPV